MKILILMAGFFPGRKYGGPPVSVDNFCSLLNDDECYIVTRNHDLGEEGPYSDIVAGWNDRGNCRVKYLTDEEYNAVTFGACIRDVKPDILYLQGLFQSCVLPSLVLARKYGIKVLLAPRGELCQGALSLKKYKKVPYILALRISGLLRKVHYQSTSNEETEAIRRILGASDGCIHCVSNIPSIPAKDYVARKKKGGVGRFVFLSRIHPKKNLLMALECLERVTAQYVEFSIYGPLEDASYWERCQQVITRLPDHVRVNYCGLVSHDEVHKVFSEHDAFLFPTLSENYGHVIAEALIVGCPVIISDQTPWNDVNQAGAGWAIPLDDRERFVEAIQTIVDCESEKYRLNAKSFAVRQMDLHRLKAEYTDVLAKM